MVKGIVGHGEEGKRAKRASGSEERRKCVCACEGGRSRMVLLSQMLLVPRQHYMQSGRRGERGRSDQEELMGTEQ